jgi:uncharacterized delta-60 repeat protein
MYPAVSLRRALRSTALAATLAGLALSGVALANISVVSSFGHKGILRLGSGQVLGLAAAGGNGVVAVGYQGKNMLVTRISSRGSRRSFSAGRGVATSVAIQPDGKIVVAGTTAPTGTTPLARNMVVERFKANGSLDRSFGSGGKVHLKGAIANSVAVGRRGLIVVGGSIPGSDGSPRVALASLQASGKPVSSFGHGGFDEVDLGPYSEANAVLVLGNGKIVFAGDQSPGLQQVNALVGRVLANGKLDRGFAAGGVYRYLHPHGGGASSLESLASARGGQIVAGGGDDENSGQHALLVRLSGAGRPVSVSTSLSETEAISGAVVGIRALAVTRGGEILGAGYYLKGVISYATVWALRGNGTPDPGQGRAGLVATSLPSVFGGQANAAALSGGSLFTAGAAIGPRQTQKQGFVIRYQLKGIR